MEKTYIYPDECRSMHVGINDYSICGVKALQNLKHAQEDAKQLETVFKEDLKFSKDMVLRISDQNFGNKAYEIVISNNIDNLVVHEKLRQMGQLFLRIFEKTKTFFLLPDILMSWQIIQHCSTHSGLLMQNGDTMAILPHQQTKTGPVELQFVNVDQIARDLALIKNLQTLIFFDGCRKMYSEQELNKFAEEKPGRKGSKNLLNYKQEATRRAFHTGFDGISVVIYSVAKEMKVNEASGKHGTPVFICYIKEQVVQNKQYGWQILSHFPQQQIITMKPMIHWNNFHFFYVKNEDGDSQGDGISSKQPQNLQKEESKTKDLNIEQKQDSYQTENSETIGSCFLKLCDTPLLENEFDHQGSGKNLIIIMCLGKLVIGGDTDKKLYQYDPDGTFIQEKPTDEQLFTGIYVSGYLYCGFKDSQTVIVFDDPSLDKIHSITVSRNVMKIIEIENDLFIGQWEGFLDIIQISRLEIVYNGQFKTEGSDPIYDIEKLGDQECAVALENGLYFFNIDKSTQYFLAMNEQEKYLEKMKVICVKSVNSNILYASVENNAKIYVIDRKENSVRSIISFDGRYILIDKIFWYGINYLPYFIIQEQSSINIVNVITQEIASIIQCNCQSKLNQIFTQTSTNNGYINLILLEKQSTDNTYKIKCFKIADY